MIDLIVKCFNLEFPSATCKLVAIAVARRCGGDLGECFASQATLAADTQVHAKTVGRCLAELEELGWISRTKFRATNDGKRRTDRIFLTLPAVTLPATGQKDNLSDPGSPASPDKVAEDSLDGSGGLPKETTKRPDEESSTAGLSSGESDQADSGDVDLGVATDLIWARVGDKGRERSSRADVRRALASAIGRRSKGETPEQRLQSILRGIDGYLRSDEATRDGGAYERGAHRTIEKDRWEGFASTSEERAELQSGTFEEPSPALQRMWMDLYKESGRWPAERGPRPGQPGCRVDEDLLEEFGVTLPSVVDEDDGAFD